MPGNPAGRDLPGFFYDEAKGKYFRIVPDHVVPQGSKKAQRFSKISDRNIQKNSLIHRSNIFEHPLGGGYLLQSEMGISPSKETRVTTWAKGLERKSRFDVGIGRFCYDDSRDLYHLALCRKTPSQIASVKSGNGYLVESRRIGAEIIAMELCHNHALLVLAVGRGSPQTNSIAEVKMVCEGPESGDSIYRGGGMTMTSPDALWAAAANNHVQHSEFAVANGVRTLHLIQRPHDWWILGYSNVIGDSDVLDVDWLDENVVVRGHRNGRIALLDTRIEPSHRSIPIESPSCVAKARALDRNRIAVAGLKNELNLYDLRYNKRLRKSRTMPFVQFPSYRNRETPGYLAGFDVNLELNAIAAACDFGLPHETVTLFDASSGKALTKGNPNVHLPTSSVRPSSLDMATCVRFASQGKGQPTLMVSSDTGLEEWCWNHKFKN